MNTTPELVKKFKELINQYPDFYAKLLAETFAADDEIYDHGGNLVPSTEEIPGYVRFDDLFYDVNDVHIDFMAYSGFPRFKITDSSNDGEFLLDKVISRLFDLLVKHPSIEVDISNLRNDNIKKTFDLFREEYERRTDEEKLLLELSYPHLFSDRVEEIRKYYTEVLEKFKNKTIDDFTNNELEIIEKLMKNKFRS